MSMPLVLALNVPPFVTGLLVVLFILLSLLMVLVVLIQRPQGGGLSGAFGGSSAEGAGQTAFGAKTGDALTTATILIFVLFIVGAVVLNFTIRPGRFITEQPAASAPAGTAAPATPAPITIQDSAGQSLDGTLVPPASTPAPAPAPAPEPTPTPEPAAPGAGS